MSVVFKTGMFSASYSNQAGALAETFRVAIAMYCEAQNDCSLHVSLVTIEHISEDQDEAYLSGACARHAIVGHRHPETTV